jgi:hypothetical protein
MEYTDGAYSTAPQHCTMGHALTDLRDQQQAPCGRSPLLHLHRPRATRTSATFTFMHFGLTAADNPRQHWRRPRRDHQTRPHIRRNAPHCRQHRQRQIPLCRQVQGGCQGACADMARGNARDLARGNRRPRRGGPGSQASSPNIPRTEDMFDRL